MRKTAAVCVAKLYDINAGLVEDQGFLDQLKDLLSDSNPMVNQTFLITPSYLIRKTHFYNIIFPRWWQMQLQLCPRSTSPVRVDSLSLK